MSTLGIFDLPFPANEPVLDYLPKSPERASLQAKLVELSQHELEIPLLIGGEEVKTGNLAKCVMPHNHGHVLAQYHKAGAKEVAMAIDAAMEARKIWAETPWEVRASIFKKMAVLLAGPYRDLINAATMLNQSKNAYQAEIDSAAELVDFYNFNAYFMQEIYADQPPFSPDGQWNRLEYRPLEGFVFAVTPFNFTSIAGNLPTSPALMGNVVLWKPASSAVYAPYFLMQMFREAGMPAGVINFIPGSGGAVGDPVMASEHLAGIHFTGSTPFFRICGRLLATISLPTIAIRGLSARRVVKILSLPIQALMSIALLLGLFVGPSSIRVKSAQPHHGPTFRPAYGGMLKRNCWPIRLQLQWVRQKNLNTSSMLSSTRPLLPPLPNISTLPK
jgi:1-pyrroline-5-carboxylate dehydrogenase